VRWIREASPGALAAVIVGVFVVANVVGVVALLIDPCDGLTRPIVWAFVATPLFGLAMFVVCVRVTPQTWIAIVAALATIVVTGIALVMIILVQEAELCTV
jgi:hypothetical protein